MTGEEGSLQHPVFPGGLPPKYEPGQTPASLPRSDKIRRVQGGMVLTRRCLQPGALRTLRCAFLLLSLACRSGQPATPLHLSRATCDRTPVGQGRQPGGHPMPPRLRTPTPARTRLARPEVCLNTAKLYTFSDLSASEVKLDLSMRYFKVYLCNANQTISKSSKYYCLSKVKVKLSQSCLL